MGAQAIPCIDAFSLKADFRKQQGIIRSFHSFFFFFFSSSSSFFLELQAAERIIASDSVRIICVAFLVSLLFSQ